MIAKTDTCTFRKFLLDHEDLASSIVSYMCYLKMISNNHFKILRIYIFAGKIFTSLT